MKILVINMYSVKSNLFKKIQKKYEHAFQNKAKLHFVNWNNIKKIKRLIRKKKVNAIILSGSDYMIKQNKKSYVPDEVFSSNIPILGICYGFQYMSSEAGAKKDNIGTFKQKSYKKYRKYIRFVKPFSPFNVKKHKYLFYHHDYVINVPDGWKIIMKSKGEKEKRINAAYEPNKKYFGIQFHPEYYKKSGIAFFSKWLKWISE